MMENESSNDLLSKKAITSIIVGIVAVLGILIVSDLITEQPEQTDLNGIEIDVDLDFLPEEHSERLERVLGKHSDNINNFNPIEDGLTGSWNIDAIIYVIIAGISLIVIGKWLRFVD